MDKLSTSDSATTLDVLDDMFQQLFSSIDNTTTKVFPTSDAIRNIISSSSSSREERATIEDKVNTIHNALNGISNDALLSSTTNIDDDNMPEYSINNDNSIKVTKDKNYIPIQQKEQQPKNSKMAFGFGASLSSSSKEADTGTKLNSTKYNAEIEEDENIANALVNKTKTTSTLANNETIAVIEDKEKIDTANDITATITTIKSNDHDGSSNNNRSKHIMNNNNTTTVPTFKEEDPSVIATSTSSSINNITSSSSNVPKLYQPGKQKMLEETSISESDM